MARLKFPACVAALLCLAACAQPATLAVTAPDLVPAGTASPVTLMGATTAMLSADFGRPALLRVDGTSQVWLYRSDVCALNLILFPDRAGVPRVASAVPDGDPAACMASLARQTDALEQSSRRAMERLSLSALERLSFGALERDAAS